MKDTDTNKHETKEIRSTRNTNINDILKRM